MEEKIYFSIPALSNSDMAAIYHEQGGSPAKYKKYIIDREKPKEETPSLENGKLIHLYVEKPTEFVVSDVDRPTDMLAEWVEEVFKSYSQFDSSYISKENVSLKLACIKYKGDRYKPLKDEVKIWEKFQEGFEYLKHLCLTIAKPLCITSGQKVTIENCINSLKTNPYAKKLLFDLPDTFGDEVLSEQAYCWNEVVGDYSIPAKGLLDRLIIEHSKKRITLVDLKTTSKPISRFIDSIEKYRYYRQLAWYLNAIYNCILKGKPDIAEWKVDIRIVAVETTGLYETKVFTLSSEYLSKGYEEINQILKTLKFAMKNDQWVYTEEELINNGVIKLYPNAER